MMNEQLGSSNVGSTPFLEQVEDEKETTTAGCCFGRWIVAVFEFCKSIKQKYNNWQDRRASNRLAIETYKQSLCEYNISDVLMAASGEDKKLGQGTLSIVERYKMTGKDNQPYEIAYKSTDISQSMEVQEYTTSEQRKLKEMAQKRLKQEKDVIVALNHPNIIHPVFLDEKNEFATNKTVIETGTLSEEEKKSLKEGIPVQLLPDFDFEIIESVTTEPGGIPLPLADKSLKEHLSEHSLTTEQKDCAIRELTAAVGYMHKNGYFHLDIKPDNILRKGDEWFLCDFGVSRHVSELAHVSEDSIPLILESEPSKEIAFGTPGYISPQMYARVLLLHSSQHIVALYGRDLVDGKDVPPFSTDARHTDAYSLGVVLFEILTGVKPTPDHETIEDKEFTEIPALFQKHVDMQLDKHRNAIGTYYEVVAGLLKSDCSQRMTAAQAEERLARIARPD